MKNNIVLIGGGGHCRVCLDVIHREGKFVAVGIIDQPAKVGQQVSGVPIIGIDQDLPRIILKERNFLITVGQVKHSLLREKLFKNVETLGGIFSVIISPLAYVAESAELGAGTIVMHQGLVQVGAKIGRNCIINSRVLIEHDARVGDHTYISTGAIVNGGCQIGSRVFVGSGAVINQGICVGDDVTVGAGAVVVKNIMEPGVYVGCPAQKIAENGS